MSEKFKLRGRYQVQDADFIGYDIYQIPGVYGDFRGPALKSDEYVACLGAAQTFGRFVETPYPQLISRALGIDSLNLGRGGAGPTFPLSNPLLIELINRARIVVVQMFSGRSQSNSLFQTVNHGMMGHGTMGIHRAHGQEISSVEFYTWLLEQDEELARKIVAETRASYVRAMSELLDAITAPKILFWFSVRAPEYQEEFRLPIGRLWGDFPQLVNREMVDQLQGRSAAYVECISRRGLPQVLRRRSGVAASVMDASSPPKGGASDTVNRYYPSPEMHQDVAALLVPECRAILAGRTC